MIREERDAEEEKEQSSDIRLGRIRRKILYHGLRDRVCPAQGVEDLVLHRRAIWSRPTAASWSRSEGSLETSKELLH